MYRSLAVTVVVNSAILGLNTQYLPVISFQMLQSHFMIFIKWDINFIFTPVATS